MTTVDNFLAHYGVKGMKWGVRRDSSRVNGSSRSPVTDKEQSDSTRRIARNITIGAAVVAALGISAYAYHRYDQKKLEFAKEFLANKIDYGNDLRDVYSSKENGDRIIKRGAEFVRKSTTNESGISKRTFAVLGTKANDFQDSFGDKTYRIKALGDIKVASFESKLKIAADTMSDSTRKDLRKSIARGSISAKRIINKTSNEDIGKITIDKMMGARWSGADAEKFMKSLKDRGYSAVVDDNYYGDSTVIFDNAKVIFNRI